jgi:hypothetical protein
MHSARVPVDFLKAETSKGRPMSVTAHLKRSIVEVMAEENCLTHAPVIAVARVTIPITKPIGKGENSCTRSVSCCRRRVSISVEEK